MTLVEPFVTERAELNPAKCTVTGDIDGPFVDTGVDLDPNTMNASLRWRVYLQTSWLKFIAEKELGMVPREQVEALARRVREAEHEVDQIDLKAKKWDGIEKAIAEVSA